MLQAEIELDECWARLGKESFGRLAVATDSGIDIFRSTSSCTTEHYSFELRPAASLWT